jgi:hypothetical protein
MSVISPLWQPAEQGKARCLPSAQTIDGASLSSTFLVAAFSLTSVLAVMPLPDSVVPPPEDTDDLAELTEVSAKETNKWADMGYSQLR